MIDSIRLVSKFAKDRLSNTANTKVFPIVAENGTLSPFIIYKRVGLKSNGGKDGFYEDTATLSVTVVAEKYSSSVELASLVRERLEKYSKIDHPQISEVYLFNASEDFANNAYVQTMQFSIKITK